VQRNARFPENLNYKYICQLIDPSLDAGMASFRRQGARKCEKTKISSADERGLTAEFAWCESLV
jgi:hypothetical protein